MLFYSTDQGERCLERTSLLGTNTSTETSDWLSTNRPKVLVLNAQLEHVAVELAQRMLDVLRLASAYQRLPRLFLLGFSLLAYCMAKRIGRAERLRCRQLNRKKDPGRIRNCRSRHRRNM